MDDDPLVLANTLAMLEDAGHRPVPAGSGKEALAILHRGDLVDVVITDQVMPHMNGVQLAGAIKIEWPDLPVVLATGYEDMPPGDGTAHLRLSKPYTQEELTQAILGFSHRTQESGHIPPFPPNARVGS